MVLEDEEEIRHTDDSHIIIEAIADSGFIEHIAPQHHIDGFAMAPPKGSQSGRGFVTGTGGRVDNEGECHMNLECGKGSPRMQSAVHVAQATRPLLSTGRISDKGHTGISTKDRGVVQSVSGGALCTFVLGKRLYVAKLNAKRDQAFQGKAPTPRASRN